MPNTQIDSAQVVPHRNAPAKGFVARAALGSSYVARWVWGKEWGAGGLSVFEDEMKRLLGKRWVAMGGMPLRTNVNAPGIVMAGLSVGGGSGANSGTSTPYGSRSGLGATVFVEEEEDEELERERQRQLNPGVIGGGLYNPTPFGEVGFGRMRTQTSSTMDSLSSTTSGPIPSTAYTTPDLNIGSVGSATGTSANGNVMTPTTPTPLTPVVALPTSDAEAQIGLSKIAEPDLDAFMAYAAIVPEYCRLEGMVIKGIV